MKQLRVYILDQWFFPSIAMVLILLTLVVYDSLFLIYGKIPFLEKAFLHINIALISIVIIIIIFQSIKTINSNISYDEESLYIKDIHNERSNPLNFKYREIGFRDVREFSYEDGILIIRTYDDNRFIIRDDIFNFRDFLDLMDTIEKNG